jgi:hypothetical protein
MENGDDAEVLRCRGQYDCLELGAGDLSERTQLNELEGDVLRRKDAEVQRC